MVPGLTGSCHSTLELAAPLCVCWEPAWDTLAALSPFCPLLLLVWPFQHGQRSPGWTCCQRWKCTLLVPPIPFSPWKYPDVPETAPSFFLMPGLIFSDCYGNIMVLLKCNHFFPLYAEDHFVWSWISEPIMCLIPVIWHISISCGC